MFGTQVVLSRIVAILGLFLGIVVAVPTQFPGPLAAPRAVSGLPPLSPAWVPDAWRLEIEYFSLLGRLDPVHATSLGLVTGNLGLGPSSRAELAEAVDAWRTLDLRMNALAAENGDNFDLELMQYDVRRRLFELDSLRVPARDPGIVVRHIAEGLNTLILHHSGPDSARLAAVIQREQDIPRFLGGAQEVVGAPPRMLCEQAIAECEALSSFLLHGVQAAAVGIADTLLARNLVEATSAALDATWSYRQHLVLNVLPRSVAEFALGADQYRAQLWATEGINIPLAALREQADDKVAELRVRFADAAFRLDPSRSPNEVYLEEVASDQPDPGDLIAFSRTTVRELQAACRRFSMLPVPPALDHLEVGPSPRFSSYASASLASPGPFAPRLQPSRYFITMPDRAASPSDREAMERFLNRSLLRNLAAHETFPGHFTQLQYQRRQSSAIRRAITSRAFSEGWAHYAESLILDAGYHSEDLGFRMATLQSALRRAGRLRVSLGLHTEGWTLTEASQWLEDLCYLEPPVARREAERAAYQPMVSVYTLGRMEIERLRDDLARIEGDQFDLGAFHTRLLELGAPPLYMVRRAFQDAPATRGRLLD